MSTPIHVGQWQNYVFNFLISVIIKKCVILGKDRIEDTIYETPHTDQYRTAYTYTIVCIGSKAAKRVYTQNSKSGRIARFPQTLYDAIPRIWTTIWRENCASRFENKKVVYGRISKITSQVCLDFFPSNQEIIILAHPSGRPGFRSVSLWSWGAWRNRANFDASFRQIFGMELEIL
jgi:hypothetical protein